MFSNPIKRATLGSRIAIALVGALVGGAIGGVIYHAVWCVA